MIQPSDFISHAKRLVEPESVPEVDCRSAVSRAYYSLYHETDQHMRASHKSELASGITAFLRKKNDSNIDTSKINSLDELYLKGKNINFHYVLTQLVSQKNWQAGMDFKDS